MNDTVTRLLALADEYMVQERDGANGYEARQALHDELVRLFTPLSDEQIEDGRNETFSTSNPFCPCDSKTMRKAVRWAERFRGITGGAE